MKTIGILGGMGPFATVDLFQKIVINTPACIDQEHPKIIIYNNPTIPPRIFHTTEENSPLSDLIQTAIVLEQTGADFIIMPCHTAHIWYEQIKNAISIPFYSLIDETVKAMKEEYHSSKNKKALLLATSHTISSKLYQNAFSNSDFELLIPNRREQIIVDSTIKAAKKGMINTHSVAELNFVINSYYNQGVSLLMGCCTEIPLMFSYFTTEMKMIDPTLLLAKFAINQALE
ncbi:aspartate/glutamate racemase family protein [Metabacillus endolithicus]|uniref:Aspartate/glutamate racemase family protein n=1 Tax=Metabacillus endolithicus TaxID=1535204 RepID=A0ABW5C381_9BACI